MASKSKKVKNPPKTLPKRGLTPEENRNLEELTPAEEAQLQDLLEEEMSEEDKELLELDFMKNRKKPLTKAALAKRTEPYLIQDSIDVALKEWQCLDCGVIFEAYTSPSDSYCRECSQGERKPAKPLKKSAKKPPKVPAKETKKTEQLAKPSKPTPKGSDFDLREASVTHYLPTGAQGLNALIGGGFEWGSLNAFVGGPGRLKTSTLLQLAIRCGIEGRKVVYLDGDAAGSINRRRLEGMLKWFGVKVEKDYLKDFSGESAPKDYMKYLKDIMKGINVTIRGVADIKDLGDAINQITGEKWDVVIIDSLTYFYKLKATQAVGTTDNIKKNIPQLAGMILQLSEYATQNWACVVYVLQMKSKYDKVSRDSASDWTYENIGPDLIGHTLNVLVELTQNPKTRVITAEIIKDRGGVTGECQITGTNGGITDHVEETRRRR